MTSGIIDQIEEIKTVSTRMDGNHLYAFNTKNYPHIWREYSHITKHSKNIIDLLDLEDYANGNKIITINYINNYITTLCINEFGEKGTKVLRDFEIKSIATKEQFASIEYKVEAEVKENENRGN